MNLPRTLAALFVAAVLVTPPGRAGEGHDHGDAAPTTVSQAHPRFTAESESFELVGVLRGRQITLYLDRFADNSPVRDAQIELEIGGAKFRAEKHGDDEYEVVLPEAPKAGVLPVTATVLVGNEADLLAGEFDIHEETHTNGAALTHSWRQVAGWTAVAVAVLALLAWGGRRAVRLRRVRAGGAA